MDVNDMPEWYIDVMKTSHNMNYGRIPLEIVVSGNKIGKVIGSKAHQTKFRNNNEAKIFALDQLNSGLDNGTITFSVIKKDGRITQINTFEQVEHHYEI